jgi:gluconate:H+ symporter, GntP family
MLFAQFSADVSMWPFAVLAICVAVVILAISKFKLHAFVALIFAGILAGVLADKLPVNPNAKQVTKDGVTAADLEYGQTVSGLTDGQLTHAIKLTVMGFGETAGNIAIVIAMATIIGMCLMESGAADKVVRRFLAAFGERRAGMALLASTYFLSIPIFFDSMYMLMIPIAMTMAMRTGRDFTLYCMAICAGGVITHSLTVPHPGPLAMVDSLKIDTGISLWVGIIVGMVPAAAAYFVVQWLNRTVPIPLRENPAAPLHSVRESLDRPESSLPSFTASILPVVLPIFLISAASVFEVIRRNSGYTAANAPAFTTVQRIADFIGNKNVALIVGAVLSLRLLKKQKGLKFDRITDMLGPPLETAGVIILITAAGGAFGFMLKHCGVGESIEHVAKSSGVPLLVAAYVVALIIRIAQGSATVAMQTAAGMFAVMAATLPCDPIYLFLVIGFGAIGVSWMNDSGFWVVSRLSGFTERETLRTWTVLLTFISVSGFLFSLLMAALWPHPFGK